MPSDLPETDPDGVVADIDATTEAIEATQRTRATTAGESSAKRSRCITCSGTRPTTPTPDATWHLPAYAGNFRFSNGKTAPHAYVIESDGHHYVVTHTTVAGALTDDSVKRRVKKAPAPRLIK